MPASRFAASRALAIESTWMPDSASASATLGVTTVATGSRRVFNIETASGARRVRVPRPLAVMTGSTTRFGWRNRPTVSDTARTMSLVMSMPVLTALISTSCATCSICARTIC